jgi:hypothetical protein
MLATSARRGSVARAGESSPGAESMRIVRCACAVLALASALVLASACSSDSDSRSGSSVEAVEEGAPVHGEVAVTWKNLNPANPPATMTLVNESSETGRKLKSGEANSSTIKVLSDAEMGGLLAALDSKGFFRYATDGMGLDNIPDLPGKKGIVIVTQDGQSKGLLSLPGLGSGPVPQVFLDSKRLILDIHRQLPGAEVHSGLGESDERIFSAPPPKMHRP